MAVMVLTGACSPSQDSAGYEVLTADRSPRALQPAFWLGGAHHWDLTVTPDGRFLCGAGQESACCYGPMSWDSS